MNIAYFLRIARNEYALFININLVEFHCYGNHWKLQLKNSGTTFDMKSHVLCHFSRQRGSLSKKWPRFRWFTFIESVKSNYQNMESFKRLLELYLMWISLKLLKFELKSMRKGFCRCCNCWKTSTHFSLIECEFRENFLLVFFLAAVVSVFYRFLYKVYIT